MTNKIYFVAGETSGDLHGAELLLALRERQPQWQFIGLGGPRMRAIAGENLRDWIDQAAVLGLWEVLKHYRFFQKQFQRALAEIAAAKPAAVVLIDYPGFNLRLARALRRKFPAQKIIYYISPQVWAWNRRRIKKMAHWIDLMLCIFPFEPELYNASGLRAVFVGHPMASRSSASVIPSEAEGSRHASFKVTPRNPNLVAMFPGSREREVRKIFPVMRAAALILQRDNAELRFEIAAASDSLAQIIRNEIGSEQAHVTVTLGHARELLQRATAGMIASGTATLEAAVARLPFVLVYRVAWLTYFAARLVVKVKHLGMPNVLAQREIVPEFIQHRAQPAAIAEATARLLYDEAARRQMVREFDQIAAGLGSGNAAERAAAAILEELGA